MLTADLTKPCREFILSHWGRKGLRSVKEHPVSWVRHEANPHLRQLRRKQKRVPLIAVRGGTNRIFLALSTESQSKSNRPQGKPARKDTP